MSHVAAVAILGHGGCIVLNDEVTQVANRRLHWALGLVLAARTCACISSFSLAMWKTSIKSCLLDKLLSM